jgi:DMSO/TMAO reductase YedYZ molybdopterin-dependent catalytic subunit
MSPVSLRRVQRPIEGDWPVLHLEAELPACDGSIVVDGLVERPCALTPGGIRALGTTTRSIAVHCVWGWSKPDVVWEGIGLDAVLDLVGAHGSHVVVGAASDDYSACLPVEDARRGFLAWARDGEPLPAEAGGPLRFVGPEDHWGYKGVKWAARVTVTDAFRPGLWEQRVEDARGRIPESVVLPGAAS